MPFRGEATVSERVYKFLHGVFDREYLSRKKVSLIIGYFKSFLQFLRGEKEMYAIRLCLYSISYNLGWF